MASTTVSISARIALRHRLSTEFTQPTFTLEQDIGESDQGDGQGWPRRVPFRNPIQTTTTLDALNVNGYSIDFRGNDRLPLIKYPFDVTQVGGALTLVGVPVAASGTQPTTIANDVQRDPHSPQGTTNPQRRCPVECGVGIPCRTS